MRAEFDYVNNNEDILNKVYKDLLILLWIASKAYRQSEERFSGLMEKGS